MLKFLLVSVLAVALYNTTMAQPTSVFLRGKTYFLSFYDEFSGARVDSTKWDFRRDSKALSTQMAKNNVQVNGILRQFLRKETANGKSFTAGGLISEDSLHYGYYETSIKTPKGKGWHSAFWLMKQDGTGGTGVARASVEIDILENESANLNSFTCLHRKYNPIANLGTKTFNTGTLNQTFVKVACLYEPDSMTFYYNNVQVDKRFCGHLLTKKINIWLTSIGYTAPIDETNLPETFEVDYIRYYETNPPAKTSLTLPPLMDAMVQNGISSTTNFGTTSQFSNQNSSSGGQRESLLRFDLSAYSNYIGSAKLRVYGGSDNGSQPDPQVQVTAMAQNQNWTENGVTWANRPAEDPGMLTTKTISSVQSYTEFDITSYVIAQKEVAMRNRLDLKLSQLAGTEAIAFFNSKEAGINPPQLVLTPIDQVPVIIKNPSDTIIVKNKPVIFVSIARGVKAMFYQWKKNGISIPGATNSSFSITSVQSTDVGKYSVDVSYGVGQTIAESYAATLSYIESNLKPLSVIASPANFSTYAMGENIALSGSGNDPETGAISGDNLNWLVRYFRNGVQVSSTQLGSGFSRVFQIPISTETGVSVFYRIFLVAKDPVGERDTTWRDILPRTRTISFVTNPAALQIGLNGQTIASPSNPVLIEGSVNQISVPSPQSGLYFQNWSIGGNRSQNYVVPNSNQTITASLIAATPTTFNSLADAYVQAGTTSTTNYGMATTLIVKANSDLNTVRESFLRFDISSFTGNLFDARLRIYGGLSDAFSPLISAALKEVASPGSWTETGLNWSNKPSVLTPVLATLNVVGTTKKYYEFDLTAFILAQRAAGKTIIDLNLYSPIETSTRIDFNSKEAGTFIPELVLAQIPNPLTISVHPQSVAVCEGGIVSFSSSANGSPNPTIQWLVSLNNGNTWNNIPSATNPTYSFTPNISDNGELYRAVWTNSGGSQNSNTATLTVNSVPTPTISANGPLTFCGGGSVVLTSSFITGNTWSTGANTQSITVSSAGNYSVSVSNGNCSASSSPTLVTVNANPIAFSVTGGGVYCSSPGTGVSVNLNGSQTGVIYDFKFTAGGTPASISGNGSAIQASGIIGNGTILVVGTNSVTGCFSTMNGSASVQSQLASIWFADADLDGFGASNSSIQACSQPIGYVSNSLDCNDNNANINPSKAEICGNAVDDNCNGQTDENCPVYTFYQDGDGDGFGNATIFSNSNNPVAPNGYVSNSTDCNDGNGAINPSAMEVCNGIDDNCDGTTDNGTPSLLSVTQINGPAGVCRNATAQVFSVPAIVGATSYLWTLPSGVTGNSTTNSITLSFSSLYVTGNICVRAINACTQASNFCRSIVYYSTRPATSGSISGVSVGACPGSVLTYTIAPVINATTYNWTTPANASIISGQGTNSVTINFSGIFVSGTLSVNSSNCLGTSSNASLSISSKPATPRTISGTLVSVCGGSNQNYSCTVVNGSTNYNWTLPSGTVINSGQGTNSIQVTLPPTYSSGTISVTSGNACGTSTVRSATVRSVPAAPSTISGTFYGVCGGTTQTYNCSASTTGATSYTWSIPSGATLLSGQGSNIVSIAFPAAFISGPVSVFATNACGNSTIKTGTIYSAPATPTIKGSSSNLCGGGSFSYTIAAVVGAIGYQWTAPAGCSFITNSSTAVSLSIPSGFVSGTLSVLAIGVCGNNALRTLSLFAKPTTPASIVGISSTCPSASGITFTTTSINGLSYNWTLPSGGVVTLGQGTNSIVATWGAIAGNVSVFASNACGISTARTKAISLLPCRLAEQDLVVEELAPTNQDFMVYPNPGNGAYRINLSGLTEKGSIRIFNMQGVQVFSQEIENEISEFDLNLENQASGIYLIKYQSGTFQKDTKLIKQ